MFRMEIMMEIMMYIKLFSNPFGYMCAFISVVITTLLLLWFRRVSHYSHLPTAKYNLPFVGHLLRFPASTKDFIAFQKLVYEEVKEKTRVLWLSFRPVVDTKDVENIEFILQSTKYINKGLAYNIFKEWIGDGLLISSGEKWKSRRRLLTPAFHFDILKSYFGIMNHHAHDLVSYFKSNNTNKPIEVSSVVKHYSLNVICETAMGVKCNIYCKSDSNTEEAKYVEAVDKILHLFVLRILKPWWHSPFLYRYFSSDGKTFYKYLDIAKKYVQGVIEKRIKTLENVEKIESNIFLDILISSYKKGEIDIDGIIEEVNTFMFEGHDTVSSAISWTMYLLGRNEVVQNKAFDEIKNISLANVSLEDITQLKYLESVIKESMRIHPPVPGFSRMFKADVALPSGFTIPANIGFGINAYHMQRDESYWADPLEFRPERFLDGTREKQNPFSYIPFSAGPRNCIGQRFAMMELKIVMFNLLKNFQFVSVQAEHELEEHSDIIHRSGNGIWISLFERRTIMSNIQLVDHTIISKSKVLGRPYLNSSNSLRTIDWSRTGTLLQNSNISSESVSCNILCANKNAKIFHLSNVFLKTDCDEIINTCKQWKQEKIKYAECRNNSRLIVFDKSFASILWKRIKNKLEFITSDQNHTMRPFGFDVNRGSWTCIGVNDAMRFNSYDCDSNEKFNLHRDAQFCPTGDRRSVFSIIIYLNDDFSGGQTNFYVPTRDVSFKGMTVEEERKSWENLNSSPEIISFKPVCGSVLVFSQNILHEALPVQNCNKYILKTDIMASRDDQFGFVINSEEAEDYLKCLNYFREAQQNELDGNSISANELYERCLSLRYSYPLDNADYKNTVVDDVTLASLKNASPISSNNSQNDETIAVQGDLTKSSIYSTHPFSLLPTEIWARIFVYIGGDIGSESLVNVVPSLLPVKKNVDKLMLVPELIYTKGIFSHFSFSFPKFVKMNLDACCRVLAIYSIYLLGHRSDSSLYTISYNPSDNSVVAVTLSELLSCAFFNEKCYGAIYKVMQKDKQQEPIADFLNSVDCKYMYSKYGKEFTGIDLSSEMKCCLRLTHEYEKNHEESYPKIDMETETDNLSLLRCFDRASQIEDYFENYHEILSDVYDESCGMNYDKCLSNVLEDHVPSGVIMRKLKEKVSVNSDELCLCGMDQFSPIIEHSLETNIYNHLVFDFLNHKMNIKRMKRKGLLGNTLIEHINDKYTANEFLNFFNVDISELHEDGVGFNHASCQCSFADFELDDLVMIQNYPLLNHIQIIFKEVDNKIFAWTAYGGIVAL